MVRHPNYHIIINPSASKPFGIQTIRHPKGRQLEHTFIQGPERILNVV